VGSPGDPCKATDADCDASRSVSKNGEEREYVEILCLSAVQSMQCGTPTAMIGAERWTKFKDSTVAALLNIGAVGTWVEPQGCLDIRDGRYSFSRAASHFDNAKNSHGCSELILRCTHVQYDPGDAGVSVNICTLVRRSTAGAEHTRDGSTDALSMFHMVQNMRIAGGPPTAMLACRNRQLGPCRY
jgi:hypothetical protein